MAEAQPEGRRVASRYHLLEPIGRGGMGIVWRAHDELLDREVAIKEVRYADTLGEDNQENFNRRTKREARAAGRLTHPNVVVVHDVVEEDGRPWIVMQLVESRSLGKVLRQESLDRMFTPARLSSGASAHYAYGWNTFEYGGHQVIEHGGDAFATWIGDRALRQARLTVGIISRNGIKL